MVLVYAERAEGQFKKTSLEAATFGAQLAASLGTSCQAVVIGDKEGAGELGMYGVQKVHCIPESESLSFFESRTYTFVLSEAAKKLGAKYLILSASAQGKALTGRLSVRLKWGSVSGAKGFEANGEEIIIEKAVYSGKALARLSTVTDSAVISVMGNAISPKKIGDAVSAMPLEIEAPSSGVKLIRTEGLSGDIPLPEAELVVSAGRGMKGPENWGIVEELAEVIGAATACSRPVADADWRPHHEHVGQTGIAIRPNLYIAIGISGAIQHLAGVNNSKVIVVINKDPEAPFFKAADYGVVGDLFEVVPKLTEALKDFKKA